VRVVFAEYLPQELVFCVMYGLDDVFVISREVEETTAFAGGTQFGKDVFTG